MSDTEPVLIAGRYRLVEALATGGMGVVWRGWDERLQRPVAIKQLRIQPGLSASEAATARDRAMREARNTARLHHPHAVPVYDVVEHDGAPCLIMEFLPSISLQESIRQHRTLPPIEVARIGSELARALDAAHRVGIVHRDVKPGNVLLAEDGTTKLTDFGISHAIGDATLTATGMLTGTPAYLAPEVARGQPSSFASDVFSLGSTLYSATEGVPPFGQDANAMATLHRVASGHLRPPERSGPLTPLLARMLTADPSARPSMTDVSQTLAALHADDTASQRGGTAAASSTTAQLMPSPPVFAPPSALQTLMDVHPVTGGPSSGQRRNWLVAAMVVPVLAVAATVAIILARQDHSNPSGAGTTSALHSTAATSLPRSSTRPASSTATTPSQSTVSSQPATQPTAAQLAQAITDYYALLPGDTAQAFTRLTPSYQSSTAGGYSGYQQFWARFERVTVRGVSGQAPNSAQATITYVENSGKKKSSSSTEHRTFQLVLSDGQLKINASSVVHG